MIELTPHQLLCKRAVIEEATTEGISVGTWFVRRNKLTGRTPVEGGEGERLSFGLDCTSISAKVGGTVVADDLRRLQYAFRLPQATGMYLWNICDLSYLRVGLVQVTRDPAKHVKHLKTLDPLKNAFLLYRADDGITALTMYHQAHDSLPPLTADGVPIVDGYVPFKDEWLG